MLTAKILTTEDLIPSISWWLKLATDEDFLTQLKNDPSSIEIQLKAQSKLSEYLSPHIYEEVAFETAWTQCWQNHISYCQKYEGFFGYKLGQHLVTPDGEKGTIIDINISPECLKPIGIKWQTDVVYYNLFDLKKKKSVSSLQIH
ncbi:hypothetical protein PCC7424_5498 (plasmid) [Gloeothece citriformis PCC 7424]|uniref:Uncharacterized protein n=1 Tax=Gloeothece citriformis (strain PCC 7424) TaxID=65393 RepID=B7KMP5_GLOC7|nr:hypothetical protein [Gloeothece citriformis]ACK74067.1 hypothetical protein PCC7424_5498 [Gloeothece citriformis PCC 7424]